MYRFAVVAVLFCVGCTNMQLSVAKYSAQGAFDLTKDRYIRSNDVVLVKGIDGNPNRLYMRRGMNPLFGPSELLGESGVSWWQYVESNRRIQIYSSVSVAMYGKYGFVMSPDALRSWKSQNESMEKRYDLKDFLLYEHLLRKQASSEEAAAEFKQEKKMFSVRNKKLNPVVSSGSHDFMSRAELFSRGFTYEKK